MMGGVRRAAARILVPLVLTALGATALLSAIGVNPAAFFGDVLRYGLLGSSWQDSVNLFTPLLIIGVALSISFQSGVWNLGYDGQFVFGAVSAAGFGPVFFATLPYPVAVLALVLVGTGAGALWALLPGWLRVHKGVNEIVTTLVMSFIALAIANVLVKNVFYDPEVVVPQTQVIETRYLLAYLPATSIHAGVILALALAVIAHLAMTRTSFGDVAQAVGHSAKSARHFGMPVKGFTITVFLLGGALVGLAGVIETLGVTGYVRADYNPAFGLAVLPLVLMVRSNVLASIPLILLFAVWSTGATIAAQIAGVPNDLLVAVIAMLLLFLAVTEWMLKAVPRGIAKRQAGLSEGGR